MVAIFQFTSTKRPTDLDALPLASPAAYFFLELFFFVPFLEERFLGTFAPALRASERPIAIACFLLFTFLPERPLFKVPFLRSCIALFTFFCAFFPYFAI